MNDFEAYKLYVSLKNHFTSIRYDHVKYNGKTNLKYSSFEKRKDKIFFAKLAKHKDLEHFLVSNFVHNNKFWVKDLAYSENAEQIYKDWLKRRQSFSYFFKEELTKLKPSFNENFIILKNSHPLLLQYYLRKDISLETFCILLDIVNAYDYWNKELEFDPVWNEVKIIVKKYLPFISYDRAKIKEVVLYYFKETS